MSGHRIRYVGAGILAFVLIAVTGFSAVSILSDRVQGHSMQPTLKNGQRFLVTFGTSDKAARFDVLVLHAGRTGGTPIVKRVVGLPGDRLEILTDGSGYRVLLQPGGRGQWFRVNAPAWSGQDLNPVACCGSDGEKSSLPAVQTVPEGKVFVLGDNPDESTDSRTFGWADISGIVGRVGLRVWPLSAFGGIGGRPTLEPVATPAGG